MFGKIGFMPRLKTNQPNLVEEGSSFHNLVTAKNVIWVYMQSLASISGLLSLQGNVHMPLLNVVMHCSDRVVI